MEPIVVNARVLIPAGALELHAVRASGPGGQNVNKVSTKVELHVQLHAVVGLTSDQRQRLLASVAGRLDAEGRLVVTSQVTRSQSANLEDAREKVRALVAAALVAPKRRIPTRPTRASKVRRLEGKRRVSERKQSRRTPDE